MDRVSLKRVGGTSLIWGKAERALYLEKGRLEWDWWITSMCTNSSKQGAKKMEPRSFKCLPSDRTRDNAWAQTETQDVPSEYDGKHFLLCKWLNTDWGCSRRLWCVHPWKYSKVIRTDLGQMSSMWPCLSRRSDQISSKDSFQPQQFFGSKKDNEALAKGSEQVEEFGS